MKKFLGIVLISSLLAIASCGNTDQPSAPSETSLILNDEKKNNYIIGDVFSNYVNNGGLSVKAQMSNGTTKDLYNGDFTYTITTPSSSVHTPSSPFTTTGSYTVNVTRNALHSSYNLIVKESAEDVILSSISVTLYASSVQVGTPYAFDGKVTAHYSDNSTKDVTSSAHVGFVSTSTIGTKELVISYTEGGITVEKTVNIEVTAIKVTGVTLNISSKTLTVGQSFTLTPNVTPVNASNKGVTWSSSNTSVATVNNGVVTAVSAGTSNITVKTVDQGKTALCTVTVTNGTTPTYNTITPAEAIQYAVQAGSGKPTKTEYYIKGIAVNVSYDQTYKEFSGKFENTNLNFSSVKANGLANGVNDISNKEIIIKGYPELYNGKYSIGYLPASVSPTGSKYSPTLMQVLEGSSGETVAVTGVSVSPIVKTIEVGKNAVLIANVKPDNATNKNVTWSSSNDNIATVYNGVVTGVAPGNVVITVKTVDQELTATANITVIPQQQIIPVEGDEYIIEFAKHSSDASTFMTEAELYEEITSGNEYIKSIDHAGGIYQGSSGLKFGSSKIGGSLIFSTSTMFDELQCTQIKLGLSVYNKDVANVTVNINGSDEVLCSFVSTDRNVTYTFDTPTIISSIEIGASKRFYLQSVTFVCEPMVKVEPTNISIPSTQEMAVGDTDSLMVTYEPSGVNYNKGINWTSSNTSVAAIDSNGTIRALAAGTTTITAELQKDTSIKSTCTLSVHTVSVTSFKINESTATVYLNGTKQLTTTFTPNNATNKNVSWTSSDTNVATVSSLGIVSGKAEGTATITATAEDGAIVSTCLVTVVEMPLDAWTIMIYMSGNDLESDEGLATGDIEEILDVTGQPDDVNIIIETGGAKYWANSISGVTFDNKKIDRFEVQNNQLIKKATLSNANMGTSSTFESFLEWGLSEYPAAKTGVILWNHGGAMRGVCYDENYNDDSLTDNEVKSALSTAFTNTNRTDKLEFIGYDACLMAIQDIAEFNSQYFNYMVASEESEAGYGWDYDTWIDDVYAKRSTSTILKAIVDGFIADNGGVNATGEYYKGEYYPADQTLSYLNLSYMSAYKQAFESLAEALKSKISSAGKSGFNSGVIGKTKYFGGVDYDYFCTFDVYHFLTILESSSSYNPGSSYISNVKFAFDNLVEYSLSQKEAAKDAHGLALYYAAGTGYSQTQYSSSTYSNFTNWSYLSKTYGGSISSTYVY